MVADLSRVDLSRQHFQTLPEKKKLRLYLFEGILERVQRFLVVFAENFEEALKYVENLDKGSKPETFPVGWECRGYEIKEGYRILDEFRYYEDSRDRWV